MVKYLFINYLIVYLAIVQIFEFSIYLTITPPALGTPILDKATVN